MCKRLLFVVAFILYSFTFTVIGMSAQIPAASESDVTRPDKKEILDWMNQATKIPATQQDEKIATALKNISASDSATPRSDFQLCVASAYLGNAKAQRCVGYAYEKGFGVVDDLMESHAWFTLASHGGDAESEADVARVTILLNSAYPAPSEEELEVQEKAQKEKIADYQKELKK